MKQETKIIALIMAVFAVFLIVVVLGNVTLTGFVTLSEDLNGSNITSNVVLTREQANLSIEKARADIETLKTANLSVLKMQDLLIEAENAMQIAQYASILRGEVNSTDAEKSEARKALALINWNSANYSDVYKLTNEIDSRKEQAFLLNDMITLKNNELSSIDSSIVSVNTRNLLESAKTAFAEERYNETQSLLDQFQVSLEKDQEKSSTLSGITAGTKNFVQRYWVGILVCLCIFVWLFSVFFRKYRISSLKRRIEKMNFENKALKEIVQKTQTERFKDNKISALIYNIRMKKYQERESEIKETLPVLEEELKKLLK